MMKDEPRGEMALDPHTLENREWWNTAQVNNHESLSVRHSVITMTTLMFFVASDLSEAQRERERLTLVPFLYRVNGYLCTYTVETARTVFVELFCTPKKLDGKPVTPRERTRQQHEQNIYRGRLR